MRFSPVHSAATPTSSFLNGEGGGCRSIQCARLLAMSTLQGRTLLRTSVPRRTAGALQASQAGCLGVLPAPTESWAWRFSWRSSVRLTRRCIARIRAPQRPTGPRRRRCWTSRHPPPRREPPGVWAAPRGPRGPRGRTWPSRAPHTCALPCWLCRRPGHAAQGDEVGTPSSAKRAHVGRPGDAGPAGEEAQRGAAAIRGAAGHRLAPPAAASGQPWQILHVAAERGLEVRPRWHCPRCARGWEA
jgi:hypothetical protein